MKNSTTVGNLRAEITGIRIRQSDFCTGNQSTRGVKYSASKRAGRRSLTAEAATKHRKCKCRRQDVLRGSQEAAASLAWPVTWGGKTGQPTLYCGQSHGVIELLPFSRHQAMAPTAPSGHFDR